MKKWLLSGVLILSLIPGAFGADRNDKLIINTLNQINQKVDNISTKLSDFNSRLSKVETWKTEYDKNIDRFYYPDLKEVQGDINTLKEEWSQTKGFMIALVVIGGMLGTIITWVLEYWGLRPMRA